MNNIILRGIINNIQYSHTIDDVEFYSATIVNNNNGHESINSIKFKKLSNPYKNGDYVEIVGNIRTYSEKVGTKNKVHVYVFTYFDSPYIDNEETNIAEIDGRICTMNDIRVTKSGKENLHFILANNIYSNGLKLNSYIPCVAWGKIAKQLSSLPVNTQLELYGELQSREYKKILDNNELEINIAHEFYIKTFNIL